MKNKELLSAHVANHWISYLIYAIVATFIWCYAITLWTKDKPKEVVTIYVLSYGCESDNLASKLEEVKDDYLRHVRVNYDDRTNPYVNIKYQGLGTSCDIVIVPESFIESMGVESVYSSLDKDYMTSIFGELEYYTIDEKYYGIKLFDKNSEDNGYIKFKLEDTEDENYYIFLNKKSLHMGEINNSDMDGAIKILKELLNNGTV